MGGMSLPWMDIRIAVKRQGRWRTMKAGDCTWGEISHWIDDVMRKRARLRKVYRKVMADIEENGLQILGVDR